MMPAGVSRPPSTKAASLLHKLFQHLHNALALPEQLYTRLGSAPGALGCSWCAGALHSLGSLAASPLCLSCLKSCLVLLLLLQPLLDLRKPSRQETLQFSTPDRTIWTQPTFPIRIAPVEAIPMFSPGIHQTTPVQFNERPLTSRSAASREALRTSGFSARFLAITCSSHARTSASYQPVDTIQPSLLHEHQQYATSGIYLH